jgi:hypothetical protein
MRLTLSASTGAVKVERDLGGNVINKPTSHARMPVPYAATTGVASTEQPIPGSGVKAEETKQLENAAKSFKRERDDEGRTSEAGDAKRQKSSLGKPEMRRQLSDTGGAQNAEATGKITQDDVIAELVKMGGRMPLKQLMKAFKKVLKDKTGINRENFMSFLKNVTRTEKDAVTNSTIIVLKQQFGGL